VDILNLTIVDLFDLSRTQAKSLFEGLTYGWEILPRINSYLQKLFLNPPKDFKTIGENVWVGTGTIIEPSAVIKGPCIIGHNCEIRHSAYIRGNAIIGDEVTIGNSTEVKNSILFDGVDGVV
jgi:NDP-sugar pyrophosphorylase family protein